jgi:predicted MFS family arabinose efflux permease
MIVALVSLPWVVDSGAGVIAAVLVWGVAYGAIPLALSTWMQLTSPQLPEASSAMLVTTFQIAIASGSLLGGMIVDGYGIEPTLFFGAVLGGLGLVAMATFGLGHDRLINKLQG